MGQKIWQKDFILLTSSNFLLCVTYYSLISTLPLFMAEKLDAAKSAIGVVMAVFTIASITARPATGFILDKIGRKTIFISAIILYTFFFVGYLVADSILLIIMVRFMQGIGWGVEQISGSTIAVDIIPEQKRGEGLGYYSLSTTLGMSFGPLVGLFICQQLGYLIMFEIMLLVSLSGLICGYFLKLPQKMPNTPKLDLRLENIFDYKAIIPSFNLFVIMMAYGGMISFVALYGKEMGIKNTSLYFFILSIGVAFSRIIVGKKFDRNGPAQILTTGLMLNIIGFSILALIKNPLGYFSAALIIGYGNGVVFPVFQAMIINLAKPGHRGAANSTLYTFLDAGMGIGMILTGMISQHISMSGSFLFCAFVSAAGLVIFLKKVLRYYNSNLNKI